MVYLSLYRRQRPLNFSDMIGQEHVARTLSRALVKDRLSHAYLFCGPRGTGKTTAAKILARAANCHKFPAPEPCGQCPSCKNIAAGVAIDVIEMDAASNRGIDEIRELRERTRYASGESRYKVYIIDEAHMLTHDACNAFLKTLEEPPPGVIFVLATTEPSRLPSTIVSRCQRFDFHLLTAAQINQRLKDVLKREKWQAEEEALRLIARFSEGSMRDALGLLEQSQSYGEEKITAEHVRTVTGLTRSETLGELVEAIAKGNLKSGLAVLHQVAYSGKDLSLFVRDLTFFFSRLLIFSSSVKVSTEDESCGFDELWQRFSDCFSREELLEIVEMLHQTGHELRQAHQPHFILDVAVIRIFRVLNRGKSGSVSGPAQSGTVVSKEDNGVEHKSQFPCSLLPEESGKKQAKPAQHKRPVQKTEEVKPAVSGNGEEAVSKRAANTGAADQDVSKVAQVSGGADQSAIEDAESAGQAVDLNNIWSRLLAEVKRRQSSTHEHLKKATSRELRGELLVLNYSQDEWFTAKRLRELNHRQLVEEIFAGICGKKIALKVDVAARDEGKEQRQLPQEEGGDREPGIENGTETGFSGGRPGDESASAGGNDIIIDEASKMFKGKIIDVKEKEGDYSS